jgi:hypothetical protein
MKESERRLKLQKEAIEKMKALIDYHGEDYGYVKEEFPCVSKNTLNALVRKGIFHITTGVFEDDGPDYYCWTGKELE